MSVGSTGKWFALGLLVASLGATGCKDDDEDEVDSGKADSGVKDTGPDEEEDAGGGTDGGAGDAGSDAAAPVVCGGKTCMSHSTSAGTFAAGCTNTYLADGGTTDAEVCGISTASIFMGTDPKFLEIHAPGVLSESCGAFLDNLDTQRDGGAALPDASTKGNNQQDRFLEVTGLGTIKLSTPGCCTSIGFCSGATDNGTAYLNPEADAGILSNGGFGCMESSQFLRAAPAMYRHIPCNPDSGVRIVAPVSDAGADAGTDSGASDASADAAGG